MRLHRLTSIFARNSAQTEHLSTTALISEFMPGQKTMSVAFLRHEAIP